MKIILIIMLCVFSFMIEARQQISIPIEARYIDNVGVFAYLSTADITRIVTVNEYVPISGNFINYPIEDFELVSDPAIMYTNGSGYNFVIDWNACFSSPVNNTTVKIAIKKNGILENSSVMTQLCKTGGEVYTASGCSVVSLVYGDKIQLVVTSSDDNSNLTMVNYNTSIRRFY